LAVGALVFDIPSYGDSYSVYSFPNPLDANSFYGIDNVGNFVIDLATLPGSVCGSEVSMWSCYETYYVRTHQTTFSVNPPSLQYDDGVPCIPSTSNPDFIVLGGTCNNGHEIFGGIFLFGGFVESGVWTGPDPLEDLLELGTFRGGFINHLGDVVFINDRLGTLDWAEDLTTSVSPEPGSLFLVGSGALLLVACLIRRSLEKGRQRYRYQSPI
jgi:hypothetical protein